MRLRADMQGLGGGRGGKCDGVGAPDIVRLTRHRGPWGALAPAMVFLVALNLRPAIVAVGPVLTQLGADLGWGEGAQGVLAALPLLAFAAMSPLVRLITARLGEDATVLVALAVLAAGALIRSAGGSTLVWFGTVVIGCAIAVGNVLVPAIVKRDYPNHIALSSAVSSSCITAGSAIASLTVVSMALAWGGWRPALAFWAVPALVVAVLWTSRIVARCREEKQGNGEILRLRAARCAQNDKGNKEKPQDRETSQDGRGPAQHDREAAVRRSSVTLSAGRRPESKDLSVGQPVPSVPSRNDGDSAPLWRRPMTWWVTAFMGLQSAAFYTMTNWLPTLAASAGATPAEAGRQLFVFQVLGVICGLLIPRLMRFHGNQITAALVASAPMVIAAIGLIVNPSATWIWTVVAGCGQGSALVVALALIAMRGRTQAETVALSGIAQSIGYLVASAGPSLFGLLAEHTGGFTASLAILALLAAFQCLVALPAGRGE